MVTLIESDWQNMDILRADPGIENVKDLIEGHEYTNIYMLCIRRTGKKPQKSVE